MNAETDQATIRMAKVWNAHGIRIFHRGWVQKRRTPIVSKSESFYGMSRDN